MSKRQAFYEDCRFLYLRNNTLEQIQMATGVSITTLSKWKQEGRWEEQRKDFNRHPLAMVEKLDNIMEKIVNEIVAGNGKISAEQADQLAKLSAVKRTLAATEDLAASVILVTDRLSQFVRKTVQDEDLVGKFTMLLADFYKQTKEANYG